MTHTFWPIFQLARNQPKDAASRATRATRRSQSRGISAEIETVQLDRGEGVGVQVARVAGSRQRLKPRYNNATTNAVYRSQSRGISAEIETLNVPRDRLVAWRSQSRGISAEIETY